MSTRNKFLRAKQEREAEELQRLSQISRDLTAQLKGPAKRIKLKIAPKYVSGYTKSQGDSEYTSDINAFTAKKLFRAFGSNKGARTLRSELHRALSSHFGSSGMLAQYVDLCTQVIMHLVIQGAVQGDSDNKESIKVAYKFLKDNTEVDGLPKALEMLNGLSDLPTSATTTVPNLYKARVYSLLYPLNLAHIEGVYAQVRTDIETNIEKIAYIANAEAQRAVSRYLTKKQPSSEVLLPMMIGGNTNAEVTAAFTKFPATDVNVTYNYYRAAVKEAYKAGTSLRTGDVDASLEAARNALSDASKALKRTGLDSSMRSSLARTFSDAISQIKKVDVDSDDAKVEIEFATLDLLDSLHAINGMNQLAASSSVAATYAGEWGANGWETKSLAGAVLNLAGSVPSKHESIGGTEADPEFLDALDNVVLKKIDLPSRKPRFKGVQDNLGLALLSLDDAYGEIQSFMTITGPTAKPIKEREVTDAFKNMVHEELDATIKYFGTTTSAASGAINTDAYKLGITEVLSQILSVTVPSTFNLATPNSANWGISEIVYNKIAEGRLPGLNDMTRSGKTVKQNLKEYMKYKFAATLRGKQRRSTEDAVLKSADMLEQSIEGFRIQALSAGQLIRKNPAMGGLAKTATVLGTYAGTGAVSSLLHRQMTPDAGSVKAHAVDIAPSAVTALGGIYLAKKRGDTDLGYSLVGGALANLALRYIFKMPAVRFSKNAVVKAMQYPTNGLANLVGDLSMGPSSATPANIQPHKASKETIIAYLKALVKANSVEAMNYITIQLWESGLDLTSDEVKVVAARTLKLGSTMPVDVASVLSARYALLDQRFEKSTTETEAAISSAMVATGKLMGVAEADVKARFAGDMVKATGTGAEVTPERASAAAVMAAWQAGVEDILNEPFSTITDANTIMDEAQAMKIMTFTERLLNQNQIPVTKDPAKTEELLAGLQAAAKSTLELMMFGLGLMLESVSATEQPSKVGGFILEPGYNMNVYSGADEVDYLKPAPIKTSQSGYAQLEDAINRAKKLTSRDKVQEGVRDLGDVDIIRAAPHMANQIEDAGLGVNLGTSRTNPNTELVGLEVMGANGLWPVTPARQMSVPQGELNYTKIRQAPDIAVSPHGLFNQGVFDPPYGR